MASYTIWNNTIPSGTTSTTTGSRTDGILFTVSASCQLSAIAFYVPTGEGTLTGSSYTGTLWSTTTGTSGTQLGTQAGSGTWVAGAWNWITLSSPITLSTGVTYVAGITSPDAIQYEHNYWGAGDPGAGGIISGPINVPDSTTAPDNNQQGNLGGFNFPSSSTSSWYGIDIQVTTTAATPPSGLMMAGIL